VCCSVCAQAPARKAKAAPTMRFQRLPEPRERAFTLLVPQGWQTEGGIVRVDASVGQGALNAIAAKCDFAVKRDARGSAMIRLLPDVMFADLRGTPAGNMGLFPPGSNYNGAQVYPVMDPATFLATVAFRYAHPRARAQQVVERKPLPALEEELRAGGRYNAILSSFQYAAGMITVVYNEDGVRYREKLVTGIVDMGRSLGGLWSNQRAMLVRAPEGEFEALAPVFATIQHSVQINPQWLAGEIRGQVYRGNRALEHQKDI